MAIRTTKIDGHTHYSILDLIQELTGTQNPGKTWASLRMELERDRAFKVSKQQEDMLSLDGSYQPTELYSLDDVRQIVSRIDTEAARKFLKQITSGPRKTPLSKVSPSKLSKQV